jgi:hypothetical protein
MGCERKREEKQVMTTTTQRTQHLFLVRMWQEADAVTATRQWRGSVKHVLSEQNHYFTRLQDLLNFITRVTEANDAAAMVERSD